MATNEQLLERIARRRGDVRVGDVYRGSIPGYRYIVLRTDGTMSGSEFAAIGARGEVDGWRTGGSVITGGLIDIGRRVIDGGERGDTGRHHFIVETEPGIFRYGAGCHSFASLKSALEHWAPGNAWSEQRPWKRAKAKELFREAYANGWISASEAGVTAIKKKIKKPKPRRVRAVARKVKRKVRR